MNIYDRKTLRFGSFPFFIYFIYIIWHLLISVVNLMLYMDNFSQSAILLPVTTAVLCGIFAWKCRKYIDFDRVSLNKPMIVCMVAIFAYGVVKSLVPDTSYDTCNYHILAQSPIFEDHFDNQCAPGYFQFFAFALPDRLFYEFRMLLGYRLGTILNTLLILLTYLQVVFLIKDIYGDRLGAIKKQHSGFFYNTLVSVCANEAVLGFIIVMSHQVFMQMGTYLVDLFAIPIALEMVRILIQYNHRTQNTVYIYYYAVLCGIMFCMKLTNILYILPLLGLFLIKNKKCISIKLFFVCSILAVLPSLIYMTYNIYETGNPVFPYFNRIFQSEYYPTDNFQLERWGPTNIWETIFWPVYQVTRPDYRQGPIPNPWPYYVVIIFVSLVVCVVRQCNKQLRNQKESTLCILFVVSYYLFAINSWLPRYFILGDMIGGIIAVSLLVILWERKNIIINKIPYILLLTLVTGTGIYATTVLNGTEWSWRSYKQIYDQANLQEVLRDHEFVDHQQSEKIDAFAMTYSGYDSVASLVNDSAPIFNVQYIYEIIPEQQDSYNKKLSRLFSEGKNVYDLLSFEEHPFDEYVELLNARGFTIKSIEWLEGTLVGRDNLVLVRLGQSDMQNTGNPYVFASEVGDNNILFQEDSKSQRVKFTVGYIYNFYWQSGSNLLIEISDQNGNYVRQMYDIEIGQFIEVVLDDELNQFDGLILFKFSAVDDSGNPVGELITPNKVVAVMHT